MTSLSRRQRDRERKTIEIIDAAEKIFFSKGFNKTTMETIASELELTKPALYRYFKNKEDLYYAVLLRGTIILSEMMEHEVTSKKTGLEKIHATGIAFCKFYKQYPEYSSLMLHSNMTINKNCINMEKLSKYNNNHLKIMCEAIEIGKQDGTIRNDIDTLMTALYLVESTISVMQLSENMDDSIKTLGNDGETFIHHSLMLMRNSIENIKKIIGE
jgi:TetR/AcrR family transcriptional regulator